MTGAPAAVSAGAMGAVAWRSAEPYGIDPRNSQTHLSTGLESGPGAPGTGPGTGGTGAGPDPDPYEAYFRPAPGEPSPHTRTQVMPAIPVVPVIPAQGPPLGADHGYPSQPYQDHSRNGPPAQPAYDQPIDYQAATDRPYSEPYEGPYADDHPDDGHAGPRSNRAAMIGVGVAAAAILVIIVSLITLGGGKSTPPAPRGNSQPTEVVTPTTQPQKPAATPPPTAPTSTATVPAGHVPGQLRLGDTGAEVKWLQNRLKQLNFYDGDATGTFDQATAAAVVAFQAHAHTADPSGVVARSTKTALIAAGAKPKMSILTADPGGKKKGAPTPDDVKRLQRALSVALSQDVKASGNYDMATVGAVMQYEAAVGLGPDGMVGDRVWGALQQGKLTG